MWAAGQATGLHLVLDSFITSRISIKEMFLSHVSRDSDWCGKDLIAGQNKMPRVTSPFQITPSLSVPAYHALGWDSTCPSAFPYFVTRLPICQIKALITRDVINIPYFDLGCQHLVVV